MPNKKAKGIRAKTRRIMRNRAGRLTVNKALQDIPVSAKVQININGSVHSAIPHYRYQGKTGTVTGKRGLSYKVEVKELNQPHVLIVNPAHLAVLGKSKLKARTVKKAKTPKANTPNEAEAPKEVAEAATEAPSEVAAEAEAPKEALKEAA